VLITASVLSAGILDHLPVNWQRIGRDGTLIAALAIVTNSTNHPSNKTKSEKTNPTPKFDS